MNIRRRGFWVLGCALLVAGGFGYRAYSSNVQAAAWKALATQRERTVWMRYITAFQEFLEGPDVYWSDVRSGYKGGWRGGFRGDYMPMHGYLLKGGKVVGSVDPTFYFNGWDEQPSSAQFRLHLEKEFLATRRASQTEFEYLLQRSLKGETIRSEYRGMHWFSTKDKNGDLDVKLEFAYPTAWLPSVAEYDRGSVDEFAFGHAYRALRFVYREAFADPDTTLVLEAPTFNSPEPDHPGGMVVGYVLPNGGEVVRLQISTSSYKGQFFLGIRFMGAAKGWSRASAKKLFKPAFFPGMERWRDGQSTSAAYEELVGTTVGFSVPLGFRLEEATLPDLKKELAAPRQ